MLKTTPKHFEIFKKECDRLLRVWGLDGWNVSYLHKKMGDRYAETYRRLTSRQATIALNTEWGVEDVRPLSEKELNKLAKHEVLHVLLGRLGICAEARYVTETEVEEAEHEVIAHLLKIING